MSKVYSLYLNVAPLLDEKSMGVKNYVKGFLNEVLSRDIEVNLFVDNKCFSYSAISTSFDFSGEAIEQELAKGDVLDYVSLKKKCSVGIFFSPRTQDKIFQYEVEVVHDLGILLCDDFHDRATAKKLAPVVINSILTSDLCLSVSESTKAHLESYFTKASPRVETIGCGPAIDTITDSPEKPDKFRPYLLMLGTIEPRKNHKLLFELIRTYPETLVDFDVVIAGKNGWGKTLNQLAADTGVSLPDYESKIHVLGEVSDVERDVLLRNASALLFPSFFEGFGMPCLEAMRVGTPVVCSYSTSLVEATSNLGFYFDPFSVSDFREAIARLVSEVNSSNHEYSEKLAAAAQLHNWQAVVDRTLSALNDLIKDER